MSIYTNKSDLFMSAAEDINNDTNKCYFLVVPHSAYYSCLLLMKHLCYKKFGINNENEMNIVLFFKKLAKSIDNLCLGLFYFIILWNCFFYVIDCFFIVFGMCI